MDNKQGGEETNKKFYELFGGDQEISLLIDDFYYRMLLDKDLRDIFLKADMGRIRYH
jgi:truncated hemoglobin YjbI